MSEITREQIEKYVADVRKEFDRLTGNRACYEALIAAWERQQETCKWAAGEQIWLLSCGGEAVKADVLLATFCFHCGRRIEEVKHADQG